MKRSKEMLFEEFNCSSGVGIWAMIEVGGGVEGSSRIGNMREVQNCERYGQCTTWCKA
jgi:hypothetical protein